MFICTLRCHNYLTPESLHRSIHVPCHLTTKRSLYPVCYLLVSQRQIKRERVRFKSHDQIHSYGLWICLQQSVRVTFRWRDIKEWNAVQPGRARAQQPRARGGGGRRSGWVKEGGGESAVNESLVCLRRNLFGPVPTPSMTGLPCPVLNSVTSLE